MKSHPILVVVATVLVVLLLSAQVSVPTVPIQGANGWAGPHPRQLVSYNVKVSGSSIKDKWGTPVTVLQSVPLNGLVITEISAVAEPVRTSGEPYQIRLMQNATTQVGQWGFKRSTFWGSMNTLASSEPIESVRLGNGVPIPSGVQLTIQANAGEYPANPPTVFNVTILGYIR